MVGLALYAAKLLRDPFGFTFGDELAHLHNLQEILATGGLFGSNSILPVTPRYPGLESAAAAVTVVVPTGKRYGLVICVVPMA